MTISNNLDTNTQLVKFLKNALLHMYLEIIDSKANISTNSRNEIISKFIKIKLKDNNFKYIKRELKQLKTTLEDSNKSGETELFNYLAMATSNFKK